MGHEDHNEKDHPARLIVQGQAVAEPGYPGALGAALQLPATQNAVGYRYLADMGEYLLQRQAPAASAALVSKRFPPYYLIEAPATNAIGVIMELARRFGDRRRPDYVELIEPDLLLGILAPTTKIGTAFSLTAGGSSHTAYRGDLNIAQATTNGIDGTGVKIAVLDTGIDPAKSVIRYYDTTISGPASQTDAHGHGTAMLDIIADVAPGADRYAVRVSAAGHVHVWDLMAGVGIAVDDIGADIINLSLGIRKLDSACPYCGGLAANRSKICENYFDLIGAHGRSGGTDPVILAAAGNDGTALPFNWPARYPSLVTVGAVTHGKTLSTFSNADNSITNKPDTSYLLCPGGETDAAGNVTEYVGEGNDGGTTTHCAGTSPAVAYASSVIALLRDYRLRHGLTLDRGALLDAAHQKSKHDVASYSSQKHGMGRLIYDW